MAEKNWTCEWVFHKDAEFPVPRKSAYDWEKDYASFDEALDSAIADAHRDLKRAATSVLALEKLRREGKNSKFHKKLLSD